jgi:glutathione S-transferase
MLELYHWEPSGASLRVLAALEEKGLAYSSHFVDVLGRENHGEGYLTLNPTGELPVLAHEGRPYVQSSYICEYLEEAFPDALPLMPGNPPGNWQARYWQKFADDYLASSVSDLAWEAFGDCKLAAEGAMSAPTPERRVVWLEHSQAFPTDRLEKAHEYIAQAAEKLEQALARNLWLAGEAFTLADIAMGSWIAYLPKVAPGMLGPMAAAWLERVLARDSVQAALGKGRAQDPFAIAAPGPEATRWG